MDIKKLISESGLKVTYQRVTVLETLFKYRNHPCVEDLYKMLSPKLFGLSKATLYNILEQFCEKGIVEKITTLDGKLRYDIKLSPHHHIHNVVDGSIIDYYNNELNEIIRKYFAEKKIENFEILDVSLEIKAKPIKN